MWARYLSPILGNRDLLGHVLERAHVPARALRPRRADVILIDSQRRAYIDRRTIGGEPKGVGVGWIRGHEHGITVRPPLPVIELAAAPPMGA